MEGRGQFHALTALLSRNDQPLQLDGPHSQFGCSTEEKHLLILPRIEPPIPQLSSPEPSRYTWQFTHYSVFPCSYWSLYYRSFLDYNEHTEYINCSLASLSVSSHSPHRAKWRLRQTNAKQKFYAGHIMPFCTCIFYPWGWVPQNNFAAKSMEMLCQADKFGNPFTSTYGFSVLCCLNVIFYKY